MSTDLIAFLNARLDEDEAVAREAASRGAEWSSVKLDPEELGDAWWLFLPFEMHVRRHDPARTLREVAAKRSIIREHEIRDGRCRVCTAIHDGWVRRFCAPCPTLSSLAAIYSDHPGYRQE